MKKYAIVGMLVLLGSFTFLFLTTGKPGHAEIDCKHAEAQLDMNQCAYMDYEKADKELNAVYKKLMAAVKKMGMKEAVTGLVDAQRAWIKFRDKECEFRAVGNEGGSIYPLIYNGCLARLTRKRTTDLKETLNEDYSN